MHKITITNTTPENKSRNRLRKVFSFPEEGNISRSFFSWVSPKHPLTLNGRIYDKVYFDVKFPLFTETSDGQPCNQSAKMDIVLISDDCIVMHCITSCYTEHMQKLAANFEDIYFKPSYYYKGNPYRAFFLLQALRYNKKSNGFYTGIQQNISLLLGLTNIMHDESALVWFKSNNACIEPEVMDQLYAKTDIVFTNLLYFPPEMEDDIFGDIYAEEKSYPYLLGELLFDYLQETLDEPFLFSSFLETYSELFSKVQPQMPEGYAEFLDKQYHLHNRQ